MNEAEYESSDGGEYLPDEDELEEESDDEITVPTQGRFAALQQLEDDETDEEEDGAVGTASLKLSGLGERDTIVERQAK